MSGFIEAESCPQPNLGSRKEIYGLRDEKISDFSYVAIDICGELMLP
jgi:hypothetical protein